jgi:hypothetical protein
LREGEHGIGTFDALGGGGGYSQGEVERSDQEELREREYYLVIHDYFDFSCGTTPVEPEAKVVDEGNGGVKGVLRNG